MDKTNELFNPNDKLGGAKRLDKYLDDALLCEIKEQELIRTDRCKRCGDIATYLFVGNDFQTCNRCKSIIECFIERGYGKKSFEY